MMCDCRDGIVVGGKDFVEGLIRDLFHGSFATGLVASVLVNEVLDHLEASAY
jgi:hypothetical protein